MSAPKWDGCELVRDRDADLWIIAYDADNDRTVYASDSWSHDYSADQVEAKYGPCTPVLGPEGEPVVTQDDVEEIYDVLREVEWPSLPDVEKAVKQRLHVWEPQ